MVIFNLLARIPQPKKFAVYKQIVHSKAREYHELCNIVRPRERGLLTDSEDDFV